MRGGRPRSRSERGRVGRNEFATLLTRSVGIDTRQTDAEAVHSPETERARELRNNMTKVEWYVWSRLRGRQLGGYKFRRQVPIGPYFADFACLSARLVVEVDGDTHTQETDERKTACLQQHGYRVLRIPVRDVDESMDDVMDAIFFALGADQLDSPHLAALAARAGPSSPRGGEVN
jgi:very-short-patch-repair endonuclease